MVKSKLIIFFLFFLNIFSIVQAAEKFAYVDIDFLLNQSLAGKSITKKLETKYKTNIEKFKITEKELIDKEKKIISQKNILSQDVFKKKINDLKNEVKVFNEDTGNDTNDLIKEFSFQYDYFRTSSAHAPPYSASNTPTMEWVRLKLDQIDIKNNQNQQHVFLIKQKI